MLWTNTQSENNQPFQSLFNSNLNEDLNPLNLPTITGSQATTPQTIAFIDANISDAMTVMASVQADIKVFLDPTKDGIAQITETLGQYKDLTGVNIISHGNDAELQLGNSSLDVNSLDRYAGDLQKWSESLAAEADILLYGCKIANGETGKAFVNNLSNLTGADVAASTDITGNSLNGGNWALEYSTGNIETATPFTTSFMSNYQGVLDSLFTSSTTPAQTNVTDGSGSAGDYELGMEFRSNTAGQISAIKYYKASSETGTHTGRIWSSTGQLLASVTFSNETASGWQQQALATPLTIQPNTTYVVSVNTNRYYALTANGIASTITNGALSAVADGSNGVFNLNPGNFPTQSWNNSNYFRDIVFTPSTPPASNNPGSVSLSGTATEDQTLTANVTDTDGLSGVTINYQWQSSVDSGNTWSDIAGATAQTLTLGDAQVNKKVRVKASYTDALGSTENIASTATAAVVNVNDPGTVALVGTTAIGNIVTANVTDPDGLNGAAINYQWQGFQNNTWSNIAGATNQTLTLDNSLVGQQIRVNALYADALGGSENIVSAASNPISASSPSSLFASTLTPSQTNVTDGSGSAGDYELGMEFRSNTAGQISAIKYYKASSETGTHTGKIWSSTGQLLASVTFSNETASGWQQQALATPLTIQPNTTYVVSVNTNRYYALTANGIASTITNGALSAVADGSNGVFNLNPGNFPTQSWNNSNYFRDIVFTPSTPPASNNPGSVSLSGTATEDQTLTANVTDTDGLSGVTINYQWQSSVDSGNTWSDIAGATAQTLTLGDAQVNKKVRVKASYTDALGSSENIASTATAAVVNVNDPGTVALVGTTALGNILTANVTDPDGLNGVTINYQWQGFQNNTWSNIAGATNQTLTLDNSLVGQQIRVNALYADALGGSENIVSAASNPISASSPSSLFASTLTPSQTNVTDGSGSAGDYELGMEFRSNTAGQISAIKYYKASSETGTHTGRIWSSTGQLLASVTFSNETASGWQQQALATPLIVQPNTTYVVSVNTNSYYALTANGIASTITNGGLSAVADGSNGVFNTTPGNFPTQSWNNSNYFRDIVFTPSTPVNNTPGNVTVSGTTTEDQTLSATVADANGLTGATINYQWQHSSDNGTTWSDIVGATAQTLTLGDAQVNKQLRVKASYTDAGGSIENVFSTATPSVININDPGVAKVKGSATVSHSLTTTAIDDDGLAGITITYQWQQSSDNGTTWTDIVGATGQSLALGNSLLGKQVRATANYTDAHNSYESLFTLGTNVAAQNPIVLENQKLGTRDWQITDLATNEEIAGYAAATSINKGETLPLKVSLAQAGQYQIDIYRLGDYGGTGGRLVTSSGLLNGISQSSPTIDPNTRLVEYNWNTSYNLQIGNDWTSGLYIAKLTEASTGKQSQIWFAVRDDNRPADIGFQASFTTYEAYNNYGGYSLYNFNSQNQERAYAVSFDRPFGEVGNVESFNNMLTWEYNMVRWVESQGYDVSYYTNIDVHANPLQLYSQNAFLSAGHDEYWSMEMFNNVEKARDNGINLAFFSANTAYWRVRFEPSSTGQANRVMVSYKQDWALDPVAQNDTSQATTWFRSPEINRPENSLMGVMYVGDYGALGNAAYRGADFVVTNSSDPYYAHTGLKNGDLLPGLVGYEWDAVVNNGFTPSGVVVLSQSPVTAVGGLPPLPAGTNPNISNAVRYTAPSGAKVFSTGSIQWMWGLDSDGVTNPRTDSRAQQIAVNVFADMGAKPQTPSSGIVVV